MQTSDEWKSYGTTLSKMAALSNLFSESTTPFIHYRVTEYLFCRAFGAQNLSRSDVAVDAKIGSTGVGIKTFVYKGKPKYEKIAEFNKKLTAYSSSNPLEKVKAVAMLRNERIEFVERTFGIEKAIYHCIARTPGKLIIFEDAMPKIQTESITLTNSDESNIRFTDGLQKYAFNVSKSTLFKEFFTDSPSLVQDVIIHADPFALIESMDIESPLEVLAEPQLLSERIVLPLYSEKNGEKYVFPKSGLNQWNAGGRARDFSEVYLPIPAKAREKSPNFLPPRDKPFTLRLPDSDMMSAKVCQDGGKALMSKDNSELGNWLLRDVLGLQEGELLTYQKLEELGIDSVELTKAGDAYEINFKELGTYEEFIES